MWIYTLIILKNIIFSLPLHEIILIYDMEQKFVIYNTLSRRKELFEPLHAPNVAARVDKG